MNPADAAKRLMTIDDIVALFKETDPAEVSELAVLWASQGDVALRRGIIEDFE